jgi:hypothetical protein
VRRDRTGAERRAGEGRLRCPVPAQEIGLATETPTEEEHAILKLAALLNAEVRVKEIILQELQARIVSLKRVV